MAKKDYAIISSYIKRELDNNVKGYYGSGWKDYDYFKSLYDSRIENFDLNNSYLLKIIELHKNDDNAMIYLPNLIQGLSTDYTKIKENNVWTKYIDGNFSISFILDEIINNIINDNYFDYKSLYEINPILADLFKSIYNELLKLTELNMNRNVFLDTIHFIKNIIAIEILKSISDLQNNVPDIISYLIHYYKNNSVLPSFTKLLDKFYIYNNHVINNKDIVKKELKLEKLNIIK